MAARATYTEANKAQVYVVLTTNDGNVKRTARDTGVPENTVRRWKFDWEENGPPSTEVVEVAVSSFLEGAIDLRDKALHALRLKVEILLRDPDKVKVVELTTLMGVLDDKITRASGLATGRVEHVHSLPPADEIRQALGGVFQAALAATQLRDAEILDAEVVEPLALPPAEQAS